MKRLSTVLEDLLDRFRWDPACYDSDAEDLLDRFRRDPDLEELIERARRRFISRDLSHVGYIDVLRNILAAKRHSQTNQAEPPRFADQLLYLFLPTDQREHLPGDLEEEFQTIILPKFGRRYAHIWYWWQVIRSIIVANRSVRISGYLTGGTVLVWSVLQRWWLP